MTEQMKFFVRGNFQHPLDLIEIAQVAEAEGLDGITLSDHLLMPTTFDDPYPGTPDGRPPFALDAPWPDMWTTAGAVAATTKRLRIRSDVYVVPLRPPLATARSLSTLTVISRGRFEFGVGVGWLRPEFTAMGRDFEARGALADEAIRTVRELCRPGPVRATSGTAAAVGEMYLEPAPAHGPPSIFVGGESTAALRRAVRLGDGYIAMTRTVDDLADILKRLARERERTEPAVPAEMFEIHAYAPARLDEAEFARLVALGVTSLVVTPWTGPIASPPPLAERLDSVRRYANETIPRWLRALA